MTTMTEAIIIEPVDHTVGLTYHVLHVVERPIPQGVRRTVIKTIGVFNTLPTAEMSQRATLPTLEGL